MGKKKFTELARKRKVVAAYTENDQNTENEVCNSGDEENDSKKEANDESEPGIKKQKLIVQPDSDSIESDDQPLNGSKSSTSSAPPARKNQVKKTPKVAKGKAQPEKAATGKTDNKKPPTEASPKNDKPGAEEEHDGEDAGDDEGEYEVEAIVGHKSKRGESFFLVRWKGYDKDDDSWEPEAELNCDDLIAEYRKKKSPVTKKSSTAAKGVRGRGMINKKSATDPDKEWAVERIIGFVDDDEQGPLYHIRWKGFGAKEDTWEPESNLSCAGLIEKFKKDQITQDNVDAKQLRESPKKTKHFVSERIPGSNLRSSKRSSTKNRNKYKKEQPEMAATGKTENKKPTSEASPKNDKPGAEEEHEGEDAGDDEGEYEVEAILGHKSKRGESFFLVRWKGYDKDDDSWEPEAELNCDDLIAEYRKKKSPVTKKSSTAAKGVRGRGMINKKSPTDPDKERAVEQIIGFVDDDEQGPLYHIRWKGFGAKEDTWEPESNLSCAGLIEKFKKDQITQDNVDAKQLRESSKKCLVNE